MQRHAAFAIPFEAGDFGAAEAARAVDPDAFRAEPHRRLHGALHGAAEGDAALELLGDRIGDQGRVDLGLAHLDDIDERLRTVVIFATILRIFSMSAPFLPMTTPGRAEWIVTRHFLCGRSMTIFETAACLSFFIERRADRHVLVQQLAVFVLAGEPARIPGAVDAEPQADRIDFLSHRFLLRPGCGGADFAHDDRQMRERLLDAPGAAARARAEALHDQRLADKGLGDDEIVDIEIVVVLGVGDRALQGLLDIAGDPLARELEVGERLLDLLAADQLRQEVQLLRADAQHPGDRLGFIVLQRARRFLLGHDQSL